MDEVDVQPSYYSPRPLLLKFFGEGGSGDVAATLLWPIATSSALLYVASACISSTPYYLLTPLDITYRTNIWVISNHVLMDRTAICNEGV